MPQAHGHGQATVVGQRQRYAEIGVCPPCNGVYFSPRAMSSTVAERPALLLGNPAAGPCCGLVVLSCRRTTAAPTCHHDLSSRYHRCHRRAATAAATAAVTTAAPLPVVPVGQVRPVTFFDRRRAAFALARR